MTRTIRLQSDSNAHDRPWRVAVEQGFFAAEGLDVEYHEDNPKGTAGRVADFSKRWKELQMQNGALEVYPVCEWGAIERVQALGGGKIIGLDTTVRTGALMVRKDSKIQSSSELRKVPIAVTWHAGTFYAAIEVLEAAGVPFEDITLVHANDRLDALLSGTTQAAALMEPLVSRALAAGARKIADLRWRGGIVAGDDVDEETAAKLRRALNRAIEWLRENERSLARRGAARSYARAARARADAGTRSASKPIGPTSSRKRSTGCSTAASLKSRPTTATWCAANKVADNESAGDGRQASASMAIRHAPLGK